MFCSSCGGVRNALQCPKCDFTLKADDKFCEECGARAGTRAEVRDDGPQVEASSESGHLSFLSVLPRSGLPPFRGYLGSARGGHDHCHGEAMVRKAMEDLARNVWLGAELPLFYQ